MATEIIVAWLGHHTRVGDMQPAEIGKSIGTVFKAVVQAIDESRQEVGEKDTGISTGIS